MNIKKRINVTKLLDYLRESNMSTRSSISVKNPNGTVTTIYCHFDGYPEGVGETLQKHYNDYVKVQELISLGSLSTLDESIECPEGHSFDNRMDGYTVAYHRDRGEELRESTYNSLEEAWEHEQQEFNYYFDGEDWYIESAEAVLLKDKLKE